MGAGTKSPPSPPTIECGARLQRGRFETRRRGRLNLYVVDTTRWLVAQHVKMPNVSDIHRIDDEMVVIGTATGLFGTVSLSTDRLMTETRAGLLRSFTDQECVTYRIDPCPTLEELREG